MAAARGLVERAPPVQLRVASARNTPSEELSEKPFNKQSAPRGDLGWALSQPSGVDPGRSQPSLSGKRGTCAAPGPPASLLDEFVENMGAAALGLVRSSSSRGNGFETSTDSLYAFPPQNAKAVA